MLIEKIKDMEIRKIYVEGILRNGWGRSVLSIQIDSGYYLRYGASNNNFDNTLSPFNSDLVNYILKVLYIFGFISLDNEL